MTTTTNFGSVQRLTSYTGTSFTDSTDEAVTMTVTIPAGRITKGTKLKISGVGTSSAVNSTNDHTFNLRIGGLTGQIIATTGADNPAANDDCQLEAEVVFQNVGAASTAEYHFRGRGRWDTTSATDSVATDTDITALATTGDVAVVMTIDHSAASSGNVSIGKLLDVEIWPGQGV